VAIGVVRCGSLRLSHVLETHSYPHAVPFKRGRAGKQDVRVPTSLHRARGRGREPDESRGTLAGVMEREGVSNQGGALPGVGTHDAAASSRRQVLRLSFS